MVFGCIILLVIGRYLFQPKLDPGDILYIVQPGRNIWNQVGLICIVICIIGFFLLFYIPVATNWNKEKCNDGMMFLAPLFDKNANKTLKECAQRTLVQTTGNLEGTSYTVPKSVSTQIQSIVSFMNDKIKAIQTSMSTADNTIITKKLRDSLAEVYTDREKINKINRLNGLIKSKTNELKKLKKRLDNAYKAQSNANKTRIKQDKYIVEQTRKKNNVSNKDRIELEKLIQQQTTAQTNVKNISNEYENVKKELDTLKQELEKLGSLKTWKRELKNDIKDARKEIK